MCWDPKTNKAVTLRDVIFEEGHILNAAEREEADGLDLLNDDIEDNNDPEYLVEKIVDERVNSKGIHQLEVKWVGHKKTTWKPLEHIKEMEAYHL